MLGDFACLVGLQGKSGVGGYKTSLSKPTCFLACRSKLGWFAHVVKLLVRG
jgi:glutaminase